MDQEKEKRAKEIATVFGELIEEFLIETHNKVYEGTGKDPGQDDKLVNEFLDLDNELRSVLQKHVASWGV